MVAIFLLALAVRALHLWQIHASPLFTALLGDAGGYDAWARSLAGGDWLGDTVFYQAPLYPYFLGAVYSLLGDLWAPRVVQAILGSLACVLLALAGRRLFSPRAGLLAGFGLALYPTAVFLDSMLQKSVLDNLLLCLLLYLLAGVVTSPGGPRRWLWIGIVLGALVLTRENALVLTLPIGLWLAIERPASGHAATRAALLLAVGMALTLGPVALRNFAIDGGFHLTTSQGGPNFYIGNRAGASGTYEALRYGRGRVDYESGDARALAEAAAGRDLSPGEVSAHWLRRALDDIREGPGQWLRLLGRKALLTWNAREIEDTESQESHADLSPILALGTIFHFGVLAPLALFGLLLTRGRWRSLWLFYALILAYAGSVVLFFVLARYRFPLVPLLMLFAAAGLAELRLRSTGRREIMSCAAAALAFAVFCNWPVKGFGSPRVTTLANLGRALYERADLPAAIDSYEAALAIDPEHSYALAGLGDALFQQGRPDLAIEHYRRALAAAPRNADTHNNLGLALAAVGDAEGAVAQYRRALEVDPRHARALNNLAGSRVRAGRIDEGLELYSRSIAAEPAYLDARINRARVLALSGRLDQAARELEAARALAPENTDILELLSDLRSRRGIPTRPPTRGHRS